MRVGKHLAEGVELEPGGEVALDVLLERGAEAGPRVREVVDAVGAAAGVPELGAPAAQVVAGEAGAVVEAGHVHVLAADAAVVLPRLAVEVWEEPLDVDPDLLADLAAEGHRDLGLAVVVPEEHELRRPRAATGLLLLLLADRGDTLRRHVRIVGALIAARDEAVRDLHTLLGPERDRSGAAEVDVVGMREDRHRTARELECVRHQTSTGCMRSA